MFQCKKQLTPFAAYSAVDLAALPAGNGKLSLGYSHPAQLTFDVIAAEHTSPIERLAHIIIWDDDGKLEDDTTDQDEANPLFEGFVEVVAPGGDSNKVNLTAYDPTYRVGKEITVMSLPWEESVGGDPPLPAANALPRLVINCKNDADDDYAFERGHDGTVGNMISVLLEDAQEPLWWRNACPTDAGASDLPLVPADVDAMTFKPQEKLVWESEPLRSGLSRLERYEPRFRLLFEPGTRLWRWFDLTTAPQVTLRLNDPTVDHPVLSLSLSPSFDSAFTAIKLYGPPATETEEFIWYHPDHYPSGYSGDTLEPSGEVLLQTIGLDDIVSYDTWTIIDDAKKRGARTLPTWHQVEVGGTTDPKIAFEWLPVKKPVLLLTWDDVTWTACSGVWFDINGGYAKFNGTSPYTHATDIRGQGTGLSGQAYFPPIGVKLVWAYYTAPLSVRVPETGFEGTAYTVAGLALQKDVYDESIAVGYEYGNAVTSATRLAQMTLLAQSQLDKHKDVKWVGGCVLDGIDWQWQRLNRRVNFEAANGSGGTTAAGWDAINAYVTDVEYDFAEQTTTLTFSSDEAEVIGEDVSLLKEKLKIKALTQREVVRTENIFRTEFNYRGEAMQVWSGLNEYHSFEYVDPDTGRAT
jgi:hypothetical protein